MFLSKNGLSRNMLMASTSLETDITINPICILGTGGTSDRAFVQVSIDVPYQ